MRHENVVTERLAISICCARVTPPGNFTKFHQAPKASVITTEAFAIERLAQ